MSGRECGELVVGKSSGEGTEHAQKKRLQRLAGTYPAMSAEPRQWS